MAIEIKELHVRLFMGNTSGPAESNEAPQQGVDPCSDIAKEEQMISDTAQEVLRILKAQERR